MHSLASMKTPLLLAGLVCTTVLGGCEEPLENFADIDQAIVRGTPVPEGEYPETVMVLLGGGLCTGTIVSQQTVLTAAHCVGFGNTPVQNINVRIDVPGADATIAASSYEVHPSADLAIIKLVMPSGYDGIPLAKEDPNTITGEAITLVGYGKTRTIPVAGDSGASGTKHIGYNTLSGVVNAGDPYGMNIEYESPGSVKCNGDSGGPTFLETSGSLELLAVTSHGTGNEQYNGQLVCEATTTRSHDVALYFYKSWVENFIVANDPAGLPTLPEEPDNSNNGDSNGSPAAPDNNSPDDNTPDDGFLSPSDQIGSCTAGGSETSLIGFVLLLGFTRRRRRVA